MTNEINEAMDMLYSDRGMTEYEKMRAEQRRLLFVALGIEDDGRRGSYMTDEEFYGFIKRVPVVDGDPGKGKTTVQIMFKQCAYTDESYTYCFDDDVVYYSEYYVGD